MNILLIDDEEDVRTSLSRFLNKLGYSVKCASNGASGLREFHLNEYDLVITDLRMPEVDGIEFLKRVKKIEKSPVDVFVITGHGDKDNAVKSLKYGATDYFEKPLDIRKLAEAIKRHAEVRQQLEIVPNTAQTYQASRIRSSARIANAKGGTGIDGNTERALNLKIYSESMRKVIEQSAEFARERSISVLIEGETGTGKDLVARYIHSRDECGSKKPFININCGAIPESLFEGELFGHEQGAYTGASPNGQKGKLETANHGTIFLDEIGDLPLNLQVKLLRAIESKSFFRVGGTKEVKVDVRFISATNKDLREQVKENKFRSDLFYRINIASIRVLPLREQKESILPFAIYFLKRYMSQYNKNPDGFSPDAEKYLLLHPWLGNVRELKNAMAHLALICDSPIVDVEDLSAVLDGAVRESSAPKARGEKLILGHDNFNLPSQSLELEDLNMKIIQRALEINGGNVTRTAQYLGLSRRVLQGRLKKYKSFSQ